MLLDFRQRLKHGTAFIGMAFFFSWFALFTTACTDSRMLDNTEEDGGIDCASCLDERDSDQARCSDEFDQCLLEHFHDKTPQCYNAYYDCLDYVLFMWQRCTNTCDSSAAGERFACETYCFQEGLVCLDEVNDRFIACFEVCDSEECAKACKDAANEETIPCDEETQICFDECAATYHQATGKADSAARLRRLSLPDIEY